MVVGDFGRPITPGWEGVVADPLLREDIAEACAGDPALRLPAAADLAQRLRSLESRRLARERAHAEQVAAEQARVAWERARTRRPWVVAATVVLCLGLASSAVLYLRQRTATSEMHAAYRAEKSVTDFLSRDLVALADAHQGGDPNITLRDAVMQAEKKAQSRFSGSPRTHAELLAAIGEMRNGLGDFDGAAQNFRQALALLKQSPHRAARRRTAYQIILAYALVGSHPGQTRTLIDDALQRLKRQPTPDWGLLAKAEAVLADLESRRAHPGKALAALEQAMSDARRDPGFDAHELARMQYSEANLLAHAGRVKDSKAGVVGATGEAGRSGMEERLLRLHDRAISRCVLLPGKSLCKGLSP
jgi:hypothetical protein